MAAAPHRDNSKPPDHRPLARLALRAANGDTVAMGLLAAMDPDDGEWVPGCTELANARRLITEYGTSIRYCWPLRRWLVWDGSRWAYDDTGRIYLFAKATVRRIYKEAAAADSQQQRERLSKWATRSESRAAIENMIALGMSEPGITVTPAELDFDPWKFNVINGTIDLRTGELLRHERQDLITKLAPIIFDPDAQAPGWLRFLGEISCGDQDLAAYLQRVAGLTLIGKVLEHALFILHGTGANGKGTFTSVLQRVMGEYAKEIEPDLLLASHHDAHPTGKANLMGARLAVTVEPDAGRKLAEALVKALTGGDRISARFMRGDFFEFDPAHTIFLATNHRPVIVGIDEGIWRRIQLIPFSYTVPKSKRDPDLADSLMHEAAGILAWAVRGCLDWQHRGLAEPTAVVHATETYRLEMDPFTTFLQQCCERAPRYRVTKGAIYTRYLEWCAEGGEGPMSKKAFGIRLGDLGLDEGEEGHAGTRIWLGIRLVPG